MQLFEIKFSLGQKNQNGGFSGTSNGSNMSTTVTAQHQGQARDMVESMYGGSNACQIHSVRPL
jgi:hypothetical protein